MSLPIFGAQAAVSILNRVFTNTSPANSVFANQVANATASLPSGANSTDVLSYTAFAKSFGTAYATQTPAALSNLMLTNMGLLPNAALETALTDYITAAGVANVGIVALQLSNILSAIPTTDANYGAAARAWDAEVTSAFTYSSNVANTTALPGDVTPPPANQGQTFNLTVGVDNIAGGSGNDSIVGVSDGAADTFNNLDVINGGAGTDTLTLTNASGTMTLPTGLTVSNVENLVLRSAQNAVTADVQAWTGLTNVTVDQLGTAAAIAVTTKANATSVSTINGTGVAIADNGTGTGTGKDTLATVSLKGNTGAATIASDALTSLTVASSAANATVTAAAGTRVLGVTVDKLTGGNLRDDTATTVNVTASGNNSTGVTLTTDAATTVTFGGDKTISLALADTGGNAATVTSLTSTNTAGVTITSALAGNVAFTGGDGKDSVIVTAGNTKAINMGAGDDTVTMTGNVGVGGSVNGGDGVDTLAMTAADAATVSAGTTFKAGISSFEKVSLGAVAGGATNTVNMANLNDINYVVSAGTAPTTGTSEVQTLTWTGAADADGGVLTIGGVMVTVPSAATTAQIAAAVQAQAAAIIAANPTITSIGTVGSVNTITYANTAGNVGQIVVSNDASGVTFAGVVQANGTTPVKEQQTITVGNAPTATGIVTIGGVDVNVVLGETTAQTAARIQAALNATKPAGVESVTVAGSVVTATFTIAAGNAAALVVGANGTATFGAGNAPAVADNAVASVAAVAETQTVVVTAGTDANGGEVVVAGARIALGANLTVDQVGTAITGQLLAIQAAAPTITGVAYNTANDTLTFTFAANSGDVPAVVLVDNSAVGFGILTNAEVTPGVAGTAGGMLNVTNMANSGTFELTSAINGASSVVMKDATGTADVLNIKLNGAANLVNTAALTVAGVETINIEATDSSADTVTLTNPAAASTIMLNAAGATKLVVTGNHGVNFSGSTLTNVVNLDASGVVSVGNAAGATAAQIGATGAVTFSSAVTNKAVTVTTGNGADVINVSSINDGTFLATNVTASTINTGAGADTVTGSAGKDIINTGADADTVNSSAAVDTITLGAGNDTYVLMNATHSVIAARDVITDFSANTYGQGAGGAVTSAGAVAAAASRTGDVINLDLVNGGLTTVRVGVFANAADAQTFVQNGTTDAVANVNAALDSSTGFLYLDLDDNGTVDSVIELTGVTTITAAAFVLV